MVTNFIKNVFFALAVAAGLQSEALQALPEIHNCAPAFIAFWETAQNLPLDEKIAEFEKTVYPTFPQFYGKTIKEWVEEDGKSKQDVFKKIFDNYAPIHEKFKQKTAQLSAEFAANLQTFLKTFPECEAEFNGYEIYIAHSLDCMDGGIREIDGKLYLIFGVDRIINHQEGASDTAFFHHEFFHVCHFQSFPYHGLFWQALWVEGLATYASEALNPGASCTEISLDCPTNLVPACEKDINFLWNTALKFLTMKDDAAYKTFFLLSSQDVRIPKRAGYYLGYLIAKELAKSHSLHQLAQMNASTILPLIEATIKQKISDLEASSMPEKTAPEEAV